MAPPPPKLDRRSFDDVVAQTEALATAYSGWRPSAPNQGPDFGGALIRLFGRTVDVLLQRLGEVPRKHHLAFVDLLGAERIPPRPARAPVTFQLADDSVGEAQVPSETQVAASGSDGPTFETELSLNLTRSKLIAAFVRDVVQERYADRTSVVLGSEPGPFAAFGVPENRPVEHQLYVAVDPGLGLAGATGLTLVVDPGQGQTLPAEKIAWSAHRGGGWAKLAETQLVDGTWKLVAPVADIELATVNGSTTRWLAGAVPVATPPLRVHATVVIAGAAAAPDAAFCNTVALDVTSDLRPFGDRPAFNDTFYLGCDAAFAVAGAEITLTFGFRPSLGVSAAGAPALAWEVWDGRRALAIAAVDTTAALTKGGTVKFTLAGAIPTATVGGISSRWIRVRLVDGHYGEAIKVAADGKTLLSATFAPPTFASLALAWSATLSTAPSTCLRRTDRTYEDVTAAASAGTLQPYRAVADSRPAFYLGFDRPFEPGLATLYLQVFAPPAPAPEKWDQPLLPRNPPRLAWEYYNGSNWQALSVEDGTRGLARSGLVRFLPSADAAALVQFGQTLFWLRVRALDQAFGPMPQLGRVLTNTVWASHALTTRGETLGASSGGRGQVFKLSDGRVLAGQRIEVGEPDRPAADELKRLQREEGLDAVTTEDDPARGLPIHWVRWHVVPDFWGSGPRDRHYTFDAETGRVTFGDGRRGLIPPTGLQNLRAAWYRSGGGEGGNVSVGALTELKTSLPFVDSVSNTERAAGGAAIEPEAAVIQRASHMLRHGGRAVTAEDFVDLALNATAAVARAVSIAPSFSPIDWLIVAGDHELHRDGEVIVVVVPATLEPGTAPAVALLTEVEDYLRARCAPGAAIKVTGPHWVPVQVTVHVVATSLEQSGDVLRRVRAAVVQLLDPLTGGDGRGWDFGRRPRSSDIEACIMAVRGVDHLSYLRVRCGPPFHGPESSESSISLDQLSLSARLLAYLDQIAVSGPGPVTP